MTYDELTNYLMHYLEHDQSHSAIMLTGDWGSGKSYYINNHLIPALEKDGDNRCVVVSLYGMHDVLEISKGIYLDLKVRKLPKNSEIVQTGRVIAKTLIKGFASHFSIDFKSSDEELRQMYESVNLSNKLIILEDAERSSINILELLGYVNGLVEQDNVKVLIVSNEDALLQYTFSEPDNDGKRKKQYTRETIDYLTAKEKTVGDTIVFQPDYLAALHSIILSFGNARLSAFAESPYIDDIGEILYIYCRCMNLRTFIYACQKTLDIYELGKDQIPPERCKCIFYSIIAFSTRIKQGIFPEWEGTDNLSISLSLEGYPLYRFCYDYIRWQRFDIAKVNEAFIEHQNQELYACQANCNDPDFAVIENFYVHVESEVRTAVEHIEENLIQENYFPFYCYCRLVVRLVQLRTIMGLDYSTCKERMIKNIRGKSKMVDGDLLFLGAGEDFEGDEKTHYEEFKKAILDALNEDNGDNTISFTYHPEDLSMWRSEIQKNRDEIVASHKFLSKLCCEQL